MAVALVTVARATGNCGCCEATSREFQEVMKSGSRIKQAAGDVVVPQDLIQQPLMTAFVEPIRVPHLDRQFHVVRPGLEPCDEPVAARRIERGAELQQGGAESIVLLQDPESIDQLVGFRLAVERGASWEIERGTFQQKRKSPLVCSAHRSVVARSGKA
ncbi:MAG: hypothetical protein R3B96_03500 [Pirellulaceae bacterium]